MVLAPTLLLLLPVLLLVSLMQPLPRWWLRTCHQLLSLLHLQCSRQEEQILCCILLL